MIKIIQLRMIENVTIQDIQDVSKGMNIELTQYETETILNEYNRVVMDKGESWNEILKELISVYR